MRNIFKILILVLIFSGCKSERDVNYTVLYGEINNSKSDFLVLKNNFWEPIDTIDLKNGKFRDTLKLPKSYYYLSNNDAEIDLYLKPGMELNLGFDTEDIVNTTVFSGNGSLENNYLVSKTKLTVSIPIEKRAYSEYGKLDEVNFLKQTDSIKNAYLKNFQNQKGLNGAFSVLERNSILIDNAIRLAQFESIKRTISKNPLFEVSKSYPNPYLEIDMNDPKLMDTYWYRDLVQNYVSSLVTTSDKYSEASDFFLLFQKELSKSNLDSKIKDRLGLDDAEYGFSHTQDKEKYYQEYMSFVKIEEYKIRFQKKYNAIKKERGSPSPNFEFIDIDEKIYTLDSFKGKYIYIDLWASWCSPCIAQIPYLKKLEEKYSEKINFISIAWADNKSDWKRMLSKQNLKGIQLFAPDKNADFFKFYNVAGIPRFILLDKEGNIIESMAKQPSEKGLEEQFANLE